MNLDKDKLLKRYSQNVTKWKTTGWVPIPKKIIFDVRLSRAALVVFPVLLSHMFRGSKYCFPQMSTIADETKLSTRSIRRAVKELKDCGYLIVESGKEKGTSNRYYFNIQL